MNQQFAQPQQAPAQSAFCPACGAAVMPGQRYCLACGEPVAGNGAAAPASQRRPRAERAQGAVTPGVAAFTICLAVLFLAVGILVGRTSVNSSSSSQSTPSTQQQTQPGTSFGGATTTPTTRTTPNGGGTTLPGNTLPTTQQQQPGTNFNGGASPNGG